MQLHQIKRRTKNRKPASVGRGGKRGKTSGRGTKGQKARSGHKLRPEIRDIIKRIPKKRGFGKNRAHTVDGSFVKASVVNLARLDKAYTAGDTVSPATLAEKGFVRASAGRLPKIKILADGEITKKLVFSNVTLSTPARAKIEKAGGSVA